MDVILLSWTQKRRQKKEGYSSDGTAATVHPIDYTSIILGVLIGAFAAYTSWECSTAEGRPSLYKWGWAIVAFIFGAFYLLVFFMTKEHGCGKKVTQYPVLNRM